MPFHPIPSSPAWRTSARFPAPSTCHELAISPLSLLPSQSPRKSLLGAGRGREQPAPYAPAAHLQRSRRAALPGHGPDPSFPLQPSVRPSPSSRAARTSRHAASSLSPRLASPDPSRGFAWEDLSELFVLQGGERCSEDRGLALGLGNQLSIFLADVNLLHFTLGAWSLKAFKI